MEAPEVDIRKRQLRITFTVGGAIGAGVGIWMAATHYNNHMRDFAELQKSVALHEQQLSTILAPVGGGDVPPRPSDDQPRWKYRHSNVRPGNHRPAVSRASGD